jgi:hypothetical protein
MWNGKAEQEQEGRKMCSKPNVTGFVEVLVV